MWLAASILDSAAQEHYGAEGDVETQCSQRSELWRQMDQFTCFVVLQI